MPKSLLISAEKMATYGFKPGTAGSQSLILRYWRAVSQIRPAGVSTQILHFNTSLNRANSVRVKADQQLTFNSHNRHDISVLLLIEL